MRRFALALVLVVGACTAAEPVPATITPALAGVRVISSEYGTLSLMTAPGARCTTTVTPPLGRLSDGPPGSVSGQADAAGALTLTYVTPFVPGGTGTHAVICNGAEGIASASADFTVASGAIRADRFTARVIAAAVIPDEHVAADPSLVPLRDAAVAKLNSGLPKEWKAATRDLSSVELVAANADIVIKVIAARATSLHRTAEDGSQDILLYVADSDGPYALDNVVAVALHEVGHVWCCHGPGTSNGHWTTAEVSEGLQGIDRFGLMNDPVRCLVVPSGFLSCPNRFSDRELRAMGFQQLPPPPADPCIARRDAILSQLASRRSELDGLGRQIDEANALLAKLKAEIDGLERQYPSGMPPEKYSYYKGLIDWHNSVAAETRTKIDSYNGGLAQYNALVAQRNSLGC